MVFEELVGFLLGGVEVPFRVSEVAVERVAQNLLEMTETLLIPNDLNVVGLAKLLQFLDFLGGEGIGGRDVGVALGLEGVLGVERERIELAFSHLRDETFQVIHADDGSAADVVLPSSDFEVGPIRDGHARQIDVAAVACQKGVAVKLFQALRGVEKPCRGGGLHADGVAADGQFVGLVLVFGHAEMVGLEQLNEVFSLDYTSGKQCLMRTDLSKVVAKHRHDLADFGIGGIVGEDDVLVPMELTLSGLHLLWRRQDMDVLREGAQREKA